MNPFDNKVNIQGTAETIIPGDAEVCFRRDLIAVLREIRDRLPSPPRPDLRRTAYQQAQQVKRAMRGL